MPTLRLMLPTRTLRFTLSPPAGYWAGAASYAGGGGPPGPCGGNACWKWGWGGVGWPEKDICGCTESCQCKGADRGDRGDRDLLCGAWWPGMPWLG